MVHVVLVEKDQVMAIMLNAWQLLSCQWERCCVSVLGSGVPVWQPAKRVCLDLHKRGAEERDLGFCVVGFSLRRLSASLEPSGSSLKFHTTLWPLDRANSLNSTLTHNNLIISLLTPHLCAERVLGCRQTLKVLIEEENLLPHNSKHLTECDKWHNYLVSFTSEMVLFSCG